MNSDGREKKGKRRGSRPAMSVLEAYSVMDLKPGADRELVHATYRRLALKYHPDHNSAVDSLERFKQLATAYRILGNKFRLDSIAPERVRDECDRCGDYAVLHAALDGTQCCAACLSLANRRPLLPAPPITIVSCATTIVLLSLAMGCLMMAVASGDGTHSAAALALGVASMFSLAFTCVTVVYTADPRQLSRRPKLWRNGLVQPSHADPPPSPQDHGL